MKLLITLLAALCTLLTMSFAYADVGTVESYFSPDLKSEGRPGEDRVHLYLQNNCNRDVFIATRTLNPNGVWESRGFTHLYPGQVTYQVDMKTDIYYLHAFTSDRGVIWQGPHLLELRGRIFPALLVQLPKEYHGSWTTILYCY